ncbi:MAG TPA: protein-L-isoaspartate(D-aspartate) O-methyltransferase [Bryobacteraceae bacterium]|nr:protein-L-isoaspartate(D-aspartate) O-methyltransferase [Bryobacteraceae bacterium]
MNQPAAVIDWPERRREMVERQIQARGIRDPRVLEAMRVVPREKFISPENRHLACVDEPVAIGFGQTISQPYITALMVESLELQGDELVLEVGGGCGYHAAVLGALAARVVSVEIIPELAEEARRTHQECGLDRNVVTRAGDASGGWPDDAPYDAISVAAAAPDVPAGLLDQLKDPGRLVIPVGSLWDQELRVIVRRAGVVHSRLATYCRFVPLRGGAGWG